MAFQTNRKRMVTFSSIGLTDIVMLLLIFFLLSSSFIVQPGIKVKLPKAATGQTEDANKIYLTITRTEKIFLNQKPVTENELGGLLSQLIQEQPDRMVVIQADKDLSLEKTIRIVDIAKMAGAEKFLIATESLQ